MQGIIMSRLGALLVSVSVTAISMQTAARAEEALPAVSVTANLGEVSPRTPVGRAGPPRAGPGSDAGAPTEGRDAPARYV